MVQRVALPRRIVAGLRYLLTRRCAQRGFRLRPSDLTTQIFAYALALAMARVAGRGREILAIQAATALLTLGIGALLLPTTGLTGVAIAWLAAQGAVAVVTFWRRLLPVLRGRDLARA